MSYNSKYTGQQVEALLDQVNNGTVGSTPDLSGYATKAELNGKVDKVDGKQLSTEDFTAELKNKLSGLKNYDDTEIQEAVSKLRTDLDTLVSGDTTTAINTFNEIIAFLDGLEDTEDLASIIASIEQQIALKQDKIDDLDAIRSGASKGATALQEHQDISGKQDKLVSGTNIKTVNGKSILGSGNITIEGGGSGSESPIFFTHFSLDQFCLGYVMFTDEQKAAIREAASKNKIIAIPYTIEEHCTGFIVATYTYSCHVFDGEEHWSLNISVIDGSMYYKNYIDNMRDHFSPANLLIKSFERYFEEIEVDEDGYAIVSSEVDDSLFFVLGECRHLSVYCYAVLGATVRFFTGEDCTLEMPDTCWANGIVPTIEPYTHYELSIAFNQEYYYNAVLIPFKSV